MKKINEEDLDLEKDYNFLLLCNNFVVDILQYSDIYKWSSEKIQFKEKDRNKINSSKYDLFYLRDHGYANTINKSLYKHIIFSLISDYIIYMSDAVDCASKGHFGTAFTLLRKPLKDDLLLIEMLYVKGYRFIPKFLNNPIDNFAIDKMTKDEKMKILRSSCKKNNFFTAKKLYDLRYSKKSKESLEKIWNKTSHIITTAKDYATENGNLNIIFATKEIVEENLIYFYKVCCSIQLYFITLLLNILKDENLISEDCYLFNMVQMYFAYSYTLNKDLSYEILSKFSIKCNNCNNDIKITDDLIIKNNTNNTFKYKCNKCRKTFNVDGFKLM